MSRRRKCRVPGLPSRLKTYADKRNLDYARYSPYHMRLMDGGYLVLDIWTTGRYYVLMSDYAAMIGPGYMVERGGEKGELPVNDKLDVWLDRLFFPEIDGPNKARGIAHATTD